MASAPNAQGLGYKNLALKGSQDSSGVWSYTDPMNGFTYKYNPVSGSTSMDYGNYLEKIGVTNKSLSSATGGGKLGGTSGSGSNTTGGGGLFGSDLSGGFLGTGVNFDDYVNRMKDLTQWRLGIDKQAMQNAYGFRDLEANRDYGFQRGLAEQQITGQKELQGQQIEGTSNLEKLRNEYMGQRQTQQLENQKFMQQAGFNQQNQLLANNAQRAKALFFNLR